MTFREYYKKESLEQVDVVLYKEVENSFATGTYSILNIIFISLLCVFIALILLSLIVTQNLDFVFLVQGLAILLPFVIIFSIANKDSKNKKNDKNYVENIYAEKYIKKHAKISEKFLDLEYDESILSFQVDLSFSFDNFVIDYNESSNTIRILTRNLYIKPISLQRIKKYALIDEGKIICSAENGTEKFIQNIKYNNFSCNILEFRITFLNDNNSISTFNDVVIKNRRRNSNSYYNVVSSLNNLFSIINNTILKDSSGNDESMYNVNSFDNSSNIYNKLLEIKELYDRGIIDKATYEDLKNKLIDKYKE